MSEPKAVEDNYHTLVEAGFSERQAIAILKVIQAYNILEWHNMQAALQNQGGVGMKRIFYTGTPESVERIMDVVGTKGVNNSPGRLYIKGDYLNKGDCITVEDGFWWIDHGFKAPPKKHPVEEGQG